MLESIDKKLNIFRIPDGPSTHVDDLSAQHLCSDGAAHVGVAQATCLARGLADAWQAAVRVRVGGRQRVATIAM